MKLVYFLFFYVFLGTTSITIPILLNNYEIEATEVSIGLVTIVMSTVGYNASEKLMQLYDEKTHRKVFFFINLIALVLALFVTTYVCISVSKQSSLKSALYTSIITYVLSCIFWWLQNWNNKNLENTSAPDALGGGLEQF